MHSGPLMLVAKDGIYPVEPVMFTQNFVRITVTRSFQLGATKFGSVV